MCRRLQPRMPASLPAHALPPHAGARPTPNRNRNPNPNPNPNPSPKPNPNPPHAGARATPREREHLHLPTPTYRCSRYTRAASSCATPPRTTRSGSCRRATGRSSTLSSRVCMHCTHAALHARGTRAERALQLTRRARIHTACALAPTPPPPFALSQAHGTRGLWSCCPPPLR